MKEGNPTPKKPFWLRMNRQLYIILICFSISTLFWLLLALSNDYTTTITFPVNYVNLPGKKVVMNELPASIDVQLRTTGFRIISFGLHREQDPVEVDVSERFQNTSINAAILALPTAFFLKDFSRELGKEVSIVGFNPDSIIFNFSDLVTRQLPVVVNYKASFERQYDTTGPPSVVPSYIEVSGPPAVISRLQQISTETIYLENLKGPVKRTVPLKETRLTTYSIPEVEFFLPVEKFTEGSVEIDIKPINVNTGYTLKTFPDKVKVRYLVAISNYNKVDPSMFDAVVDGEAGQIKHTSKLPVQIITSPSNVRISMLEPEKVDYILRRQ
jgi:hypothetical protein